MKVTCAKYREVFHHNLLRIDQSLIIGDEDISFSGAPADPPNNMQAPMTRARMRQLNLEVSLFLSDPFHTFKNRLLPNDVIFLRNIREGHEGLRGHGGGKDD